MIHTSEVTRYAGTMDELVEEIGNLKYDALARFLELLAHKIEADGKKDESRNRDAPAIDSAAARVKPPGNTDKFIKAAHSSSLSNFHE